MTQEAGGSGAGGGTDLESGPQACSSPRTPPREVFQKLYAREKLRSPAPPTPGTSIISIPKTRSTFRLEVETRHLRKVPHHPAAGAPLGIRDGKTS